MICGIQVYCLIEITNLLMEASLLALAKSIYYQYLGMKAFDALKGIAINNI